jgi:hypothetical protein
METINGSEQYSINNISAQSRHILRKKDTAALPLSSDETLQWRRTLNPHIIQIV